MKKMSIVLVAIIFLSLSAFAEKPHNSGKMYAMANNALVEPMPSCVCTCGRTCDGSCSSSFELCSLGQGFACIIACCRAAPRPGPEECGNP